MKTLDDGLRLVQGAKAQGADPNTIAAHLHEDGFDLITAIKAVRAGLGLRLEEAKQIVEGCPAWAREAEASESLRQEALEVLRDLDADVGHVENE